MPSKGRPLPYAYPRAGARGIAPAAADVEVFLAELAAAGAPPAALGPTLVQGFARFYRRLPPDTPGIDKSQIPLLYALLGSGSAPLKMSQEDASYQVRPVGDQRCGNCSSSYRSLTNDEVVCSQIEGTILEGSWCRLWNLDRL